MRGAPMRYNPPTQSSQKRAKLAAKSRKNATPPDQTMKLYAIRIFTTDWDRSLDFYQETVGLPLVFNHGAAPWPTSKTRTAMC